MGYIYIYISQFAAYGQFVLNLSNYQKPYRNYGIAISRDTSF